MNGPAHPRLARLAAATGHTNRRRSTLGEGPVCPTDPRHGPMFVMSNRSLYCPDADHTIRGERSTWPAPEPER